MDIFSTAKKSLFVHFFVISLLLICVDKAVASAPIYWINGSGQWDDPNHWSKNSGGAPFGGIPTANSDVIFNNSSGLNSSSIVVIPPGDFPMNDFSVLTSAAFTLTFDGSTGNKVALNILGDLTLSANMSITYNSASSFHNEWNFVESNEHDITTNGQDLLHVQFVDENAIYNQVDALTASLRIRHYGGTWNTNNHDVSSEYIYFRDTNSSSNPLTKVLNAGSSNFYCDLWDSKLTYQSLTVNGTYNIYTQQFIGSPGNAISNFNFHNIHLLEFTDIAPGGTSQIEHNNFECTYCSVNEIIIEDTGLTQLAGRFTVENKLEVTNIESTIAFNGGNGRLDEVVINGNVIVPEIMGCDERTIFTNIYNNFTKFIRTTGTLHIQDAIINNIQTEGGANFTISNSVLSGSSIGWTENSPPESLTYVWIGSGTIADWNNPANWQLDNGSNNGCLPKIVDHVFVNSQAMSDINIPAGFTAECKDFIWKNTAGRELKLSGTTILKSTLKVAGDFGTHSSAIITPINSHDIIFVANGPVDISTNNVQLPDIRFESANGEWHLKNKLNADDISFESGTLVTESNDIETDYWVSIGTEPKIYYFEDSHVLVNGEFKLSIYTYSNVTFNPGTSLIECEKLTSTVTNMYDLKLNNTSTYTLSNYPYVMNDLILNTANTVRTENNIELNNLVFNVNNSKLEIDPTATFTVNGGIESNTVLASPAILKSKTVGVQAVIDKAEGNVCASGYITITDINASLSGTFHAPKSTDNGNNSGINFDDGTSVSHLYWIGGSGNWSEFSNWSRVSGGCPSDKDPMDFQELFIDNNGIYTNANTITVNGGLTANNLNFNNSINAKLVIPTSFTVNNLTVNGGYATLQNKYMIVNTNVNVENGGALIIDLINLKSGTLTTGNGIVILRPGTEVVLLE
jgi:hypothetical protein